MRILRIIIDPILRGRHLSEWYNVDVRKLHSNVLSELTKITDETFIISDEIVSEDIPVKEDGYQYTPKEYWKAITVNGSEHRPDWMDYNIFIKKFDLISRKNNNEFDEVHIYGFPWIGAFESKLVSRKDIYCNSGGYVADCDTFAIMGFNGERQVQEAVEAYGHRTEFILQYSDPSFWNNFSKDCGTIHIPHNTKKDYDWGNLNFVECHADKYIMNPYEFKPVMRNSEYWGSNGLGYFEYWFSHIPKDRLDIAVHPDKIIIKK
jgi:hypothetical protein